jgi:hypothetical protein
VWVYSAKGRTYLLGSAMGLTTRDRNHPAEQRRRGLLNESDELLDHLEALRLRDRTRVPKRLKTAIEALQKRLGRSDPPPPPSTLRAAHDLVLSVQQRLMAANPRNLLPRAHAGRANGQPVVASIKGGGRWKFLSLPPPPVSGPDRDWLTLVDDTVDRACDRWAYAQHQVARAARDGDGVEVAMARARAAWRNYWELRLEAERLRISVEAARVPEARPP